MIYLLTLNVKFFLRQTFSIKATLGNVKTFFTSNYFRYTACSCCYYVDKSIFKNLNRILFLEYRKTRTIFLTPYKVGMMFIYLFEWIFPKPYWNTWLILETRMDTEMCSGRGSDAGGGVDIAVSQIVSWNYRNIFQPQRPVSWGQKLATSWMGIWNREPNEMHEKMTIIDTGEKVRWRSVVRRTSDSRRNARIMLAKGVKNVVVPRKQLANEDEKENRWR